MAHLEYPPTMASRWADKIRGATEDDQSALPPTAIATSAGGGPQHLGVPSLPIEARATGLPIEARAAHNASAPSGGTAPSRQQAQLGLPLAALRQKQQSYVTTVAAVASPLRAHAKRNAAPSRSMAVEESHASDKYPRWALRSMSDLSSLGLDGCSHLSYLSSPSDRPRMQSSIKFAPDVFLQARHQTLLEKYDILDAIYEQNTCAVYIVKHKDNGRTYACKMLYKVDHEAKAMRKEIEMLRRLDHPNIVKLCDILEDHEALFLILELCHGGDLFEKISAEGRLTEQVARIILRQVLDALAFCNAKQVVHRDVKPENFLLVTDDPKCLTLKLTDFGISTAIRPARISTGSQMGSQKWPSYCESAYDGLGSLPYMAPECFTHHSSDDDGYSKCDLWSAGVLLYFALSGQFPYGNQSEFTPGLICSGKSVEFTDECWRDVSEDAKDLIRKLLNHNVDQRLTAQQALEHRWFNEVSAREGLGELGEFPGFGREANGVDMSPRKAKCVLLQALRSWKKKLPLRRYAITAMARKLSEDCETQRLAKTIYKMFSDSSNTLRCDRLKELLTEVAQSEAAECASVTSKGSVRSWKVAGMEVSKRLNEIRSYGQSVFRRLAVLPETPDTSPCTDSPDSMATDEPYPEDLSDLVNTVDGNKSGKVQYTLLVAALLPEHVYCDDLRIQEAFEIFDIREKGLIRPHDLRVALQCPSGHPGFFTQMVQACDLDGDGALDLAEFRAMVRGEVGGHKTPANKTPSDKTPSDKYIYNDKKPFTGATFGKDKGSTGKSPRLVTL